MVMVRSALAGIPVDAGHDHRLPHAPARTTHCRAAVGYVLAGFQQDFPVVDGDRLVGILTAQRPRRRAGAVGPETPVAEVMQTDFVTADPHEMLQTAFERLQTGPLLGPCRREGRPAPGLLTADNLAEVLMIQQTLRDADRPGLFGRPARWSRTSNRPANGLRGSGSSEGQPAGLWRS